MRKRILTIFLSALLLMSIFPLSINASTTIKYDVKYNQVEARDMLTYINKYRSSKSLSTLSYDYGLEELAMTRAAEVTLLFSHFRPDGSEWKSIYDFKDTTYIGENIASNFMSSEAVVKAWTDSEKSQDELYNLSSSFYKYVGVAYVEINAADSNNVYRYYVAFFSSEPISTAYTKPSDDTVENEVTYDDDSLNTNLYTSVESYTVGTGKTSSLPKVYAGVFIYNSYGSTHYDAKYGYPRVSDDNITWSIEDTSIAKVENSKIIPLKQGTTTLTAKFGSTTKKIELEVLDNYVSFTDIGSNDWYTKASCFCYEKGLMKGTAITDDGVVFSPKMDITRSQIVRILANMSGEDISIYADTYSFTDVKSGKWYHNAVEWAKAKGVSSGTGLGKFSPDAKLTRQELATLLFNYLGKPSTRGDISSFSDYAQVSSWALDSMKWAVGTDLIHGSGGMLAPKDVATRAQVAVILYNYYQSLG